MAASALKDARTFSTSGYPQDITLVTSYKPTNEDVRVTGGGNLDGKTFCLNADALSYPSLRYHIDSTHTTSEVESGTCPVHIKDVAISPLNNIRVDQVLTATVNPSGATVDYQWIRYDGVDLNSAHENIGSNQITYTLTSLDSDKYIRVVAMGKDQYSGTVTSNPTSKVLPVLYSLTTSADANGTASGGGGNHDSGSSPTISASPNTGYQFNHWSGSTGCSGLASHTITMNENKSCMANFSLIPAPAAPSAPSISVALSGGSVLATISPSTCASGTVQYGINSRVNDGSWTGWTGWSGTITASQTASDGVKYGYQAQARCYDSVNSLASSTATGSEATYVDPIAAPAGPSTSVTYAGTTIYASVSAVSCTSGTVQYGINSRVSDGAWEGWSAWSSTTTASRPAGQGYKFGYYAQARCVGTYTTSTTSSGVEGAVVYPIFAPAAPTTMTPAHFHTNVYAIVNFGGTTCPVGTWVSNGVFRSYDWNGDWWYHNWGYNDSWTGLKSGTVHVDYYAKYTCSSSYYTSGYSPELFVNNVDVI